MISNSEILYVYTRINKSIIIDNESWFLNIEEFTNKQRGEAKVNPVVLD